jgi:hypothetical protein
MINWLRSNWQTTSNLESQPQALANTIDPNKASEMRSQQTELANCCISYAVLCSLLSPIIGYSYTGRFKSLGIFLISSLVGLAALFYIAQGLEMNIKKVKVFLGTGIAVVAVTDNSFAIVAARKKIKLAHVNNG